MASDERFGNRELIPLPPIEVDGQLEWEVEDIIDHRYKGRGRNQVIQYLILWKVLACWRHPGRRQMMSKMPHM